MSAWGASWGGAWGFKSFGDSFGASFGDSWGHCSWGDDVTPEPSVVPGFGSVRIFDRDKKKKRRQAKAISYLTRNEVENGPIDRDTNTPLVTRSIPGSIEQVGDASVRIPRLERTVSGTLPAALGASIAASDALSFGINDAIRQIQEKQSEDDDELALILMMMDM